MCSKVLFLLLHLLHVELVGDLADDEGGAALATHHVVGELAGQVEALTGVEPGRDTRKEEREKV